jgi:hypothetical protein
MRRHADDEGREAEEDPGIEQDAQERGAERGRIERHRSDAEHALLEHDLRGRIGEDGEDQRQVFGLLDHRRTPEPAPERAAPRQSESAAPAASITICPSAWHHASERREVLMQLSIRRHS